MGDIKSDFKQLVEQYLVSKASANGDVEERSLLDDLVDNLYNEAADYWYSSSAEC